jgi:hypothetical protein
LASRAAGMRDGQLLVVPPLTNRKLDPALFHVDCVLTSPLWPPTGWPDGLQRCVAVALPYTRPVVAYRDDLALAFCFSSARLVAALTL